MEAVIVTKTITMKNEKQERVKLDASLLESIYLQYYKNVYNYIGFRINNHFDAEELTSLVFEKVIIKWESYNPSFPMEAWLIGIAKNTVTDYLRSQKRKYFVSLDSIITLISPNRQPEDVVVINEENEALMVAMAKLKKQERQILSMKFATDLKYHEIANLLGISDSNVRVIAHRALKKLRKFIEEEDLV